MSGSSRSSAPDDDLLFRYTCFLRNPSPLVGLGFDECGVFVRVETADLVALAHVQLTRFGRLQRFRNHFVYARDDTLGRRGGREHAVPVVTHETFQALFG